VLTPRGRLRLVTSNPVLDLEQAMATLLDANRSFLAGALAEAKARPATPRTKPTAPVAFPSNPFTPPPVAVISR
jgi:hypothetical protein